MLDVTHSQVDVETEFGVVSLHPMLCFFFNFSFVKMIFSILQASRDCERLSDILPSLVYCKKGHCFKTILI